VFLLLLGAVFILKHVDSGNQFMLFLLSVMYSSLCPCMLENKTADDIPAVYVWCRGAVRSTDSCRINRIIACSDVPVFFFKFM